MESSTFHFAEPFWLWGLLAIPAAILLYAAFYRSCAKRAKLDRFADAHLLPHILINDNALANRPWKFMLLWSLLWSLGMLALAGPRWDYTNIAVFKPSCNLVILLDLSRSMNASDTKPSRITVAREKIEDVIKMAKGIHIGLVGYAADAHMISPITDDTRPILDLLPYLDTSLPHVQGNNLVPALGMASRMLGAEKGGNKSLLIISDGGFRDDAAASVRALLGNNVSVYAFGIGTREGAPIPAPGGGWIKDADGHMVISKLNDQSLRQIVNAAGRGFYEQAEYTDDNVRSVLEQIYAKELCDQAADKTTRIWQEHYFPFVLAMALLCLLWYRKGYTLPVLGFLLIATSMPQPASAATLQDFLLNRDQQGRALLDRGDYAHAESAFTTPYRRGVAEYRAGRYGAAEKSFADAKYAVPQARYNMANAQMMEGKYEDAIGAFEAVLKRNPKDAEARHNLDIARKLLEQQKKQEQQKSGQSRNSSQKDGKQGKQQSSSSSSAQNGKGGTGQDNSQNKPNSNAGQTGKEGEKQSAQQRHNGNASAQNNRQGSEKSAENGQQSTARQAGQKNEMKQGTESTAAGRPSPEAVARKAQTLPATREAQALKSSAGKETNPAGTGLQEMGAIAVDQPHPETQADINADRWLNQIDNDPQTFLKKQFLVESERNGTKQGDEPW